jgi:glycosyltransferase involved in cell wall biosynthesis
LPDGPLHIGYVTTGYPYVSHTFIQNEVLALRGLGVEVDTFTLRRAPLSECRTHADLEARQTTYALRPPRVRDYRDAHIGALHTRPLRYLRTLLAALGRSAGAPDRLIHQLAYFAQAVVLWDRCRRAGIRHLHAHFANVSSDVAMLAATLGAGELSWSFTMHGPTEFYDIRHYRLAEKTESARFVICISDFARSQLMGIAPYEQWPKLHVVHCGVDLERFLPVERPLQREPVSVTSVGRLVPEKGQSLLIEAVGRLRRAGHTVRLTLVGDGPQREALEAHARNVGVGAAVSFLGAVSHPRVEEVLRETDVFCLPSFAEGVPIVLMEAMAMQLAVISTRVMGIPELIEDGVSGRLIRPGSIEDLTEALSELAADPDLRRRFGRAARARVAAEFDLHANTHILRQLYARLLPDAANSRYSSSAGVSARSQR